MSEYSKINKIYNLVLKYYLSEREIECLILAKEGLRNQDIAVELNVSESCVKKFFESMFIKFKVNSRMQVLDIVYTILLDKISVYLEKNFNLTILDILDDKGIKNSQK